MYITLSGLICLGKIPQVQRSVSTSVLEVQTQGDLDPPYSKVKDSLTPTSLTPPPTLEEIYAEICESNGNVCSIAILSEDEKLSSINKTKSKENDGGYAKIAAQKETSYYMKEEEAIYNVIC